LQANASSSPQSTIAIILPAALKYSERKNLIFGCEFSVRWRAAVKLGVAQM